MKNCTALLVQKTPKSLVWHSALIFLLLATQTVFAPLCNAAPKISASSCNYARELGGVSHEGETLFLLVGATATSEEEAQKLLDNAIPFFGDMQDYFIIQLSTNFEGMRQAQWMIIEAYRKEPSKENVEFARRAFPNTHIEQVVVRTSDPIPVYEDSVEE